MKGKLLFRTFSFFLILYLSYYLATYLVLKNLNEFDSPNGSNTFVNLILIILPILSLVLVIVYMKFKSIPYNFVNDNNNHIKKVLFSFFILYFSLYLPDFGAYNSKNEILKFSFNWVKLDYYTLLLIFIGPIFEEIFFRQLLLKPFLKKKNLMILGVLVTTILFAISHFYIINYNFNIDYYWLVDLIIMGVVLSLIRIRYGLLFSITTHVLYNIIVILYKEKMCNLFILDYINNKPFFWMIYFVVSTSSILGLIHLIRTIKTEKN